MSTHYIPAYTERNGRDELTACNIWIRATEHTTEPTCSTCKQYVEDGCKELSAEDVFGAFDPLTVVKPREFDLFAGYKPRERAR